MSRYIKPATGSTAHADISGFGEVGIRALVEFGQRMKKRLIALSLGDDASEFSGRSVFGVLRFHREKIAFRD
jgi:hypothetical protein